MKKIILSFAMLIAGFIAQAQNGLEGIIVEKYYVSNAADAAGSVGALPVGSVTYRIYADMLPGYKFQAAYGISGHTLTLQTTTSFFNNEDRGATAPTYTKTQARANSVMLDSWLSVGAGCAGNFGILKSEDDVALGGTTVVNSNSPQILQNNDASAGIPLTTQDGLYAGTPEAVTFVGLGTATDVFDATSQVGNSFVTSNGSWASLNGSAGPTSANKVLIAQITTTGIFHYELNIQIGTPTGGTQNYVASTPVGAEISIPSLTGTLGAPNVLPTVNITSPSNGSNFLTGAAVAIAATAGDVDGSVASVAFYVDNVLVSTDNTAPYTATYTAAVGSHSITAIATDNNGGTTTSSAVTIVVATNTPPTVSITSPSNGALFTAPAPVTINATASDVNGSVSLVEFYVNNVLVGSDATAPYSFTWTSLIGTAVLTARATDNNSATTTSASVTISIADPNALPYKIVSSTSNCTNSSFCLPIAAADSVHNVIGYDIVLNYNKTKVTPSGNIIVSNALINPTYVDVVNSVDTANGKVSLSLFFNSSAPANAAFSGIGNLVCVEFQKNSSFGFADSALFSISSLQESYYTGVSGKLADPGKYSSYKDSAYTADVKFWSNNSPLAYNSAVPSQYLITNIYGNNANCNSRSAVAVQPDLNGNFSYNINNGQNVEITRDIASNVSVQPVINGFDVFLARKVLANDASFVPSVYQIVSMDVNLDGVISAGDISQMNQRAVLMIPEFRQAWNYTAAGVSNGQSSKDWLFLASTTIRAVAGYQISSTYPSDNGIGYSKYRVPVTPFCLPITINNYGSCPEIISGESFKGILIGDVNGNFANVNAGGLLRMSHDNKVIFDLSQAVKSGNSIDVPVLVSSADAVNALDFAFAGTSNDVRFESIVNAASYIQPLSYMNENTVRFTSNSLQNYVTSQPIVWVRFSSVNGQVNAFDLTALEGYVNGEPVSVEFNTAKSTSVMNASEVIVNLYPNPTSENLNVVVSADATVQVMDLTGRQLLLERNVSAGQTETLGMNTLANGVYMVKILNSEFSTVKKVIVQR